MENNWPMISFNTSPRDALQEFYNHEHDQSGKFTGPGGSDGSDGFDDSPAAVARINKRGAELARKYHKDQTRAQGDDYVENHLKPVADRVPARLKLAAWLHDTLEDTNATPASLKKDGVDDESIRLIQAVTSPKGEPKETKLARIVNAGADALRLKIADTSHNFESSQTIDPTLIHPEKGIPYREHYQSKYIPQLKFLQDALKEAEAKEKKK